MQEDKYNKAQDIFVGNLKAIKNKMLKPFSKVLEFREVYYDIFSSNGRKIARRYSRKNGNRRERPFEQNINEISYISPTLIYCFRLF